MGKDPSKSLEKLKKKLMKLEKQLKTRSRSSSRSGRSRARSRERRTRTRTRSRTRSRSVLRPLDSPENYRSSQEDRDDEKSDTKENIEAAIDLTSEETAATTEDVDSEILTLLGNFPQEKEFGPELLPSIVTRWEAILKKGLPKDERKELVKKYPPPSNCKVINAPKLNPEAQAAAGENVLKRDKAMELKQNQVSCAISELGLALNKLCKSAVGNKDTISYISDAARLLCDYHHTESITRKGFILTGLEKSTREGIKDTNIDEWLFGADFAEKLKACKAIKKSGQDLRGTSFQTKKTFQNNNNLNSKGTTNNNFKPKTQKPPMRPAKQYTNQTSNHTKTYQPGNTQQTNFRSRQQNQHHRR